MIESRFPSQLMSQTHNRILIIVILGALSTISRSRLICISPAFPEIAKALPRRPPRCRCRWRVILRVGGGATGAWPLLDRFGRKLPLYAGLWLFIAASVWCLFVRNVESLIALRFVQAVGGCAAGVASMAMVFLPAHETAKIISLLITVISASPMLAPSVGVFVAVQLGWKWVSSCSRRSCWMLLVTRWCYQTDIRQTGACRCGCGRSCRITSRCCEPQFLTYSVAGAFAFSGLLVYVTSSPIIFHGGVSSERETVRCNLRRVVGGLHQGQSGECAVAAQIFERTDLSRRVVCECPTALLLLVGTWFGWFGLPATLVLLFIALSSLGLAYPDAAALALVPFSRNIGSASAMLGFCRSAFPGWRRRNIGILIPRPCCPWRWSSWRRHGSPSRFCCSVNASSRK